MNKPDSKIKVMSKAAVCMAFAFCLSLILFNFTGPDANAASKFIRDGKEYGVVKGAFRHRWWNYYERGLSFADGEFFAEAAGDLKQALKQREEDQRMARTYGMHFVDYFPNRELGIVCFQTGKLEEAKRLLELSLSQYPSSKARFYLDRVRKEMIRKMGEEVAPPIVSLDPQREEIWTNADPVIIGGSVRDANFVSAVSVGNDPVFMDGARKDVTFRKELLLQQGRHDIDVTAENLLEKKTLKKIIIHVDRNGPFISIGTLTPGSGSDSKTVLVSGSALDEAGIASLSISGVDIPTQGKSEIEFSQGIAVKGDAVELRAEDRLGNVTTARINITEKTVSRPIMLASLESDFTPFLLASILGDKDKNPPAIKLKDWTDDQTVFLEKIYLEGEISDETRITSVTVNQVPVLRREGRIIFFNHFIDLDEGENLISIEARDENGNRSSKKISITRKTPKALSLSERLSVAVLPFEPRGEVSQMFNFFQENLINALAKRDRFKLVERDRLDLVLQEQKLSQTELVDKKTAIKVGKLVAAKSIITGSVVETRKGVEIIARMIDTETSEILAAKDVYDEGKDLRALTSFATGMAIKFHLEFPLVFGLIVQQKGSNIFTDLGYGKVKVPRRLIVYREEPIRHPVTGKILGSDNTILGRLRVTQVMEDLSKAKILEGDGSKIKPMDRVVSE